jgi:hypothetical protein
MMALLPGPKRVGDDNLGVQVLGNIKKGKQGTADGINNKKERETMNLGR